MRAWFLLFTILFSASVLADCCNFEVEASDSQYSSIEAGHQDDCGEGSAHSDEHECHCSPLNHFKILRQGQITITAPVSNRTDLISIPVQLLVSKFESFIFHPPIA